MMELLVIWSRIIISGSRIGGGIGPARQFVVVALRRRCGRQRRGGEVERRPHLGELHLELNDRVGQIGLGQAAPAVAARTTAGSSTLLRGVAFVLLPYVAVEVEGDATEDGPRLVALMSVRRLRRRRHREGGGVDDGLLGSWRVHDSQARRRKLLFSNIVVVDVGTTIYFWLCAPSEIKKGECVKGECVKPWLLSGWVVPSERACLECRL
mmetsp:Transcript_49368/g.148680  ORF Transcript_49368/g.148680 Transcript_49368/m.148680 type:complete len:210 (-) Transcript_49368:172-801(-)